MTTDSSQAMGLEDVRDWHRNAAETLSKVRSTKGAKLDLQHKQMADAIDAHLAARDVSDEDVRRAMAKYGEVFEFDESKWPITSRFHVAMRSALQADRQRVGGVASKF